MQEIRRLVASDGVEIAFAISGEGPPLVLPAPWVSDVELDWHRPGWQELLGLLGATHTVVRYDRPGVGQSTRLRTSFCFEDEIVYLQTVIEGLGGGPVSMLAQSAGGPPAIAVAARRPELVDKLVLYGTYADGQEIAPAENRDALVSLVRHSWGSLGSRALADMFLPGATRSEVTEFARYQRDVATPEAAADLLQMTYEMDVRAEAPQVRCPVLVMHRNADRAIRPSAGRALNDLIPGARFVELAGTEHGMQDGDVEAIVREVQKFLVGYSTLEFTSRELAAVLFTDIVESTAMAVELGDEAWTVRLEQHDARSRDAVEHFDGQLVKTTGDGVLARFALPAQALACARKIHRDMGEIGLQVRAGVHLGEVEIRSHDILGVAVNAAARVMSHGGAGETLATAAVKEVAAGSGFTFEERARTELKGLDGEWTLYRVG